MKPTREIPIEGLCAGECLFYAGGNSALVHRVRKLMHPMWGLIIEVLIQVSPYKTDYLRFYPGQKVEISD